jgi:hypothetical protein
MKSDGGKRNQTEGAPGSLCSLGLGVTLSRLCLDYALKTSSYRPACSFETVLAVATVAK